MFLSSIKNKWDLLILRLKMFKKQKLLKDNNVVILDNTSKKGNWIINKSHLAVRVCCHEPYGIFSVDLQPGQKQLFTYNITANVYPEGEYSYDDLKYQIREGERWEIHDNPEGLIMLKK